MSFDLNFYVLEFWKQQDDDIVKMITKSPKEAILLVDIMRNDYPFFSITKQEIPIDSSFYQQIQKINDFENNSNLKCY